MIWTNHRPNNKKGDVNSGKKEIIVASEKEKGKRYSILALSMANEEDTLLASAGTDKLIRVWDLRAPNSLVQTFPGHRAAVSVSEGLLFDLFFLAQMQQMSLTPNRDYPLGKEQINYSRPRLTERSKCGILRRWLMSKRCMDTRVRSIV